MKRPVVVVSGCLLGEEVRFNRGHCRNRIVTELLRGQAEIVSVCPEVAVGMGVPRPTLKLVERDGTTRLVESKLDIDWTDRMNAYATAVQNQYGPNAIHGFVLKSKSPTCGMERVPKSRGPNTVKRDGVGIFAAAMRRAFPGVPIEEEGRLTDDRLREHFIERVFAHHRLAILLASGPGPADLVTFHAQHKMQLMTHDERRYRQLGGIVARAGSKPMSQVLTAYSEGFKACLAHPSSSNKHANALNHMAGFFKKGCDMADRQELASCIDSYRRQRQPLSVPLALIRHHLRHQPNGWLEQQSYLNPYPSQYRIRDFLA